MRKFLANVLFLFVGLPLVLSTLFLVSIRPWALDREAYKRFVTDDRLYAALRAPELAARAPRTITLQGAEFDGPALTAAVQKELPVAAIKSTAVKAVDAALDAAEGLTPGGRAALDLKPLKAALKLSSPAAAKDYAAALDSSNPANPAAVDKAFGTAIDTIPDAPVLQAAPQRSGGGPMGVLSRSREFTRIGLTQALLNRMTATAVASSALLVALLGALGGGSALAKLSRGGRYLLIPSVVVLALGAVLAIPGGLILQNLIPHGLQGMVAGSGGALLRSFVASVLAPIASGFFITGLVGASVGGVLASTKRFDEPKELDYDRKELE